MKSLNQEAADGDHSDLDYRPEPEVMMITGKMLFDLLVARATCGAYIDLGGMDDHKSVCIDGWFDLDAIAAALNEDFEARAQGRK